MENNSNFIIGFSGKMGAGKNYIAENIASELFDDGFRVHYLAFADQMKLEIAARYPEYDYDSLFVNKTPDVRKLLQEYATEFGRDVYGDDMWIYTLNMRLHMLYKTRIPGKINIYIITDVRFLNELEWIEKNNGLVIRVDAPLRTDAAPGMHVSETELDNYPFKYRINNDPGADKDFQKRELASYIMSCFGIGLPEINRSQINGQRGTIS